MSHAGVASTGSRRQVFRKRESLTRVLRLERFVSEYYEVVEPEGLVAHFGAERSNFVELGLRHVVVAGHDSDRCLGQTTNRADRFEQLQPARQWHPKVENDGVRAMKTSQVQAV